MRHSRNWTQTDTHRIGSGGSMWIKEKKMPKYDRLILWVTVLIIMLTVLALGGRVVVDGLP